LQIQNYDLKKEILFEVDVQTVVGFLFRLMALKQRHPQQKQIPIGMPNVKISPTITIAIIQPVLWKNRKNKS